MPRNRAAHPPLGQLRAAYRHRPEYAEQLDQGPDSTAGRELVEHRQIRRSVIDVERNALLRMSDPGAIDDDVLRRIERELDLEELRSDA